MISVDLLGPHTPDAEPFHTTLWICALILAGTPWFEVFSAERDELDQLANDFFAACPPMAQA